MMVFHFNSTITATQHLCQSLLENAWTNTKSENNYYHHKNNSCCPIVRFSGMITFLSGIRTIVFGVDMANDSCWLRRCFATAVHTAVEWTNHVWAISQLLFALFYHHISIIATASWALKTVPLVHIIIPNQWNSDNFYIIAGTPQN